MAEVRKVITAFVIEMELDGRVVARPDIDARYEFLRPADLSDMLTCAGRVVEELRAELAAETLWQRQTVGQAEEVVAEHGGP